MIVPVCDFASLTVTEFCLCVCWFVCLFVVSLRVSWRNGEWKERDLFRRVAMTRTTRVVVVAVVGRRGHHRHRLLGSLAF